APLLYSRCAVPVNGAAGRIRFGFDPVPRGLTSPCATRWVISDPRRLRIASGELSALLLAHPPQTRWTVPVRDDRMRSSASAGSLRMVFRRCAIRLATDL